MIVRNEERCLERCLASVSTQVDEIVVVDTGSSDSSLDIAKAFNAMILEIEWPGAFDVARNVSLDQVKTDWVLWLDADEWFEGDNATKLLTNIDTSKEAFICERRDWMNQKDAGSTELIRLWKHRPNRRFVGVVHESIPDFDAAMDSKGLIAKSESIIEHDGYTGPLHKQKLERNIELILKELELRPNQLRYEIYLAENLHDLDDPDAAVGFRQLAKRVAYCEEDFSREPKVISLINQVLHEFLTEEAKSELAERLLYRIATWFPDSPPLRWAAAKVEAQRGNYKNCLDNMLAIEQMSATKEYNRWVGFDPNIFGTLLYPRMQRVAEIQKRKDIAERCKEWIRKHQD